MDLKTYISSERGRAAVLAADLGISPSYLSQLAAGTAPLSPKRCVRIERATGGEVTRQDLLPLDWQDVWPELSAHSSGTGRRKDDQPLPIAISHNHGDRKS